MTSEDSMLLVDFTEIEVRYFDGLARGVGVTKSDGVSSEKSLQPSRAEADFAFRRHIGLTSSRRLSRVVRIELFMRFLFSRKFIFSSLREDPAVS